VPQTPEQKAWSVTLSADKRKTFANWLCRAITDAESNRPVSPGENQYWWTLYEQGLTRNKTSMPWQDAADLTSYIPTEKVDALRSRIMRTVFVDPVYTIEGWGDSAKKAPFVEDFHQWAIESEGVQSILTRVIQAALVETRGVLEVYEDTTTRKVRKKVRALLAPSQMGAPFTLDPDMEPVLARDQNGDIIEAGDQDQGMGSAEVMVDKDERVRKGPGYRVLPYRDFLVLPSHAREKTDIWGYAKRFYKRWDLLQEDAKRGVYDQKAVDSLHDSNEVTSDLTLAGNPEPVADAREDKAEKELWEVQLLTNLGEGLRWYVATIHVNSYTLLRLVHEDVSTHRYIIFVPFPRTDKSHEGYSFVGHKLITIAEEHTAWRNMLADRASMEISAPVKRLVGALWDPDLQPFGPKAVIDVRDMKEIEPMQLPPAMQGAISREQEIVQASERVAGINDVALGQVPQNSRTLGEVNLVAEQSFVRMDEVIKNIQEALEDLGQVRHAIWLNCIREYGDSGMPMPMGLQSPQQEDTPGLDTRGGNVDTSTITPELLEGTFRFKPRGSTENADITKQRADFIQFMQALPLMMQAWPAMMQLISSNMEAAGSTLEQAVRLFRMPDKAAWLSALKQFQQQQAQMQQMGLPPMGLPDAPAAGGMPGPMGVPGMPPGLPPMPPQGPPQGA
jgi:hypothetical protein